MSGKSGEYNRYTESYFQRAIEIVERDFEEGHERPLGNDLTTRAHENAMLYLSQLNKTGDKGPLRKHSNLVDRFKRIRDETARVLGLSASQ